MATIYTSCPHCNGKGKVELTGVYLNTLRVLQGSVPISGADLGRLMGVKGEAMCNRLATLKRLGLVKCTQDGRKKIWTATVRK